MHLSYKGGPRGDTSPLGCTAAASLEEAAKKRKRGPLSFLKTGALRGSPPRETPFTIMKSLLIKQFHCLINYKKDPTGSFLYFILKSINLLRQIDFKIKSVNYAARIKK